MNHAGRLTFAKYIFIQRLLFSRSKLYFLYRSKMSKQFTVSDSKHAVSPTHSYVQYHRITQSNQILIPDDICRH